MDKIVIGTGMIANAFTDIELDKVIIFASGVSNSQETKKEEFYRERDLILDSLDKQKDNGYLFIYFSSIIAKDCLNTYAKHKRDMELLIEKKSKNYLIFRLPQVIGITSNTTLISSLLKQFIANSTIKIFRHAIRNLIDVDDVVRLVQIVVQYNKKNQIIELGSKHAVSAEEIVNIIQSILRINPNRIYIDKGDIQNIDFNKMISLLRLDKNDKLSEKNYTQKTIEKYIYKIIEKFEIET